MHLLPKTLQTPAILLITSAAATAGGAGIYSKWESQNGVPVRVAPAVAANLQEPGPAPQGDQLEKRLRNFRVRLTADGLLPGRINLLDPNTGLVRSLERISVLFVQGGEVKARAIPGVGGVFQVAGLTPGVYSLIGSGPDGYIAYGVEVLPPVDTEGRVVKNADLQAGGVPVRPAFFQEVEEALNLDSLAIPPRDFPAVLQLAQSYIPASASSAAPGAAPAPEEILPEEEQPAANARLNTSLQHHMVEISPNGQLQGRVRRVHPQTGKPLRMRRLNVFLVRDNVVVAQSGVSEAGSFAFDRVTPGPYSFVASGLEGFAAFAVQAAMTGDVAAAEKGLEFIIPVSATANQGLFFLDGVLISPDALEIAINELIAANQAANGGGAAGAAPPAGGGAPGVGGGGAGGGAGGGGFGGGGAGLAAALIGGIAAGVIAATQDSSGNVIVTTTVPQGP